MRAELRRYRWFVEQLCSQMSAELGLLEEQEGDRLRDRCAQMRSSLKTIVDAEQLRSGTVELAREVFDLHTVARSAVAQHAFAADGHSVRLRCFVHRDAPRRVVGDAARLRHLLGDLVANMLPYCSGGQLFVFVAREPADLSGSTVRITICDREEGPPEMMRTPASSVTAGAPALTPWYGCARELANRLGGDLGLQASGDGGAIWLTALLGTTMPRPVRSELATKAPVLMVTKDERRATVVRNALQRHGLVVHVEPLEQLVPVRLEQQSYSLVLNDSQAHGDVATFASRSADRDDVRTVPMIGVPLRNDAKRSIDEAALVQAVLSRIGRVPNGR